MGDVTPRSEVEKLKNDLLMARCDIDVYAQGCRLLIAAYDSGDCRNWLTARKRVEATIAEWKTYFLPDGRYTG